MRAGNDLGSGRIGVLVGRIALPSMLAQFISVLYSIVDRIFIGQIPGEGALALAGAGVCGPVVTMVGSVAFLVGVGGAPLLVLEGLGELVLVAEADRPGQQPTEQLAGAGRFDVFGTQ